MDKTTVRTYVCFAVASQLHNVNATQLISQREAGRKIEFDKDLGVDELGRLQFLKPLNQLFNPAGIKWKKSEVAGAESVADLEELGNEKAEELEEDE